MPNKLVKVFHERYDATANGPLVEATGIALHRELPPPTDFARLTSYSLQVIRRPSWSNTIKSFSLRQTAWPLGGDKVGQLLV